MAQKPSERPIWFLPLLGFLIPVGVGGIFLFFQWLQWESSKQRQRLAEERTEQAMKNTPTAPLPPLQEPSSSIPAESGAEELSEYAQKQMELAGVYRDNTVKHLNNVKMAANRGDVITGCSELKKAASSWKAVLISIEPIAREIKLKKPAAMDALLHHGQKAIDNMEPGLAKCEQIDASPVTEEKSESNGNSESSDPSIDYKRCVVILVKTFDYSFERASDKCKSEAPAAP